MKINTPFATAETQAPDYRTAVWHSFKLLDAMQLGFRFATVNGEYTLAAIPGVTLALHGGPCQGDDDFDTPMQAYVLLPKELADSDRELWLAFLTELRAKVLR